MCTTERSSDRYVRDARVVSALFLCLLLAGCAQTSSQQTVSILPVAALSPVKSRTSLSASEAVPLPVRSYGMSTEFKAAIPASEQLTRRVSIPAPS